MPKKYRVEIGLDAEHDIRSIQGIIAHDKPQAATQWVRKVRTKIQSLASLPERHEFLPEGADVGSDYRHLVFGNYRIIYRVEPTRVIVIRVINAARQLQRFMFPKG